MSTRISVLLALAASAASCSTKGVAQDRPVKPFHLQEAGIADIHGAIKDGQLSCTQLVQAYVNRAKAYDGACTRLVTKDGAPIPEVRGAVRAGTSIAFPTETIPVSQLVPSL